MTYINSFISRGTLKVLWHKCNYLEIKAYCFALRCLVERFSLSFVDFKLIYIGLVYYEVFNLAVASVIIDKAYRAVIYINTFAVGVNQPVLIERVSCRFGGWRSYFRCACNRRVVKLYSEGRLFLCRHCYNLPYSSKNEGFWDQSLRQRDKHRVRLSGNATTEAFETFKPKGMWWRNFYRLQSCAQAAERRADDGFIMAARRLLKMG